MIDILIDDIHKVMTNERLLVVILVVFVIGAIAYFTFTKFKQDVVSINSSPSPTPQELDFVINKTPIPTSQVNQQQTPTPQPSELPLLKNKKLSQFPGILKPEVLQNKKAVITTAKGNIEIEIFTDAPQAASNFMLLAANGFYDNLVFHRVEDWVIQGGDPLGNGTGGPGYTFADEPVTREYKKGIVAMANAGPNTNGSQFFILKQDYPLQPNYTIFGNVISGMDVVEKITVGDVMQKVTIEVTS